MVLRFAARFGVVIASEVDDADAADAFLLLMARARFVKVASCFLNPTRGLRCAMLAYLYCGSAYAINSPPPTPLTARTMN